MADARGGWRSMRTQGWCKVKEHIKTQDQHSPIPPAEATKPGTPQSPQRKPPGWARPIPSWEG